MNSTTDTARSALQAIPANIERDEWVRVGMAAKAAGLTFDDWDDWSQGGDTYKAADARDTWRSLGCNGGITAGTLFHVAKQHGWQDGHSLRNMPARRSSEPPRRKPRPGMAAGEVWARCEAATQAHPYIQRKRAVGVPLEGLRVLPQGDTLRIGGQTMAGALVVPAYGPARELQTLQLIPPDGPKKNLPGHPMTGARFMVGTHDPDAPLYLCEGIGAAWACWQATGHAAMCCFGWGNVARVAADLKNNTAQLVLVPDTGKEAAADKIAQAHGYLVAKLPEGLPDNYDVGDYAQDEDGDALALLLEQAQAPNSKNSGNSGNSNGPEPEPLRRPLLPADPYPLQSLGEVLGAAARAIHETVQAPAAMCGVSVLAAASLAAQGQADVTIDGRREPLTIWALTIGQSGERKTGVDQWALGAHRQHEKKAQEQYREDLKAFEAERLAFDAARTKAKATGKGDRDAILQALMDVGEPPEPPLLPILIAGEPTLEGLQRQLIHGWPSIGLFSDDAGEFLGGWSMSKENRARAGAGLSKLWDSGTFDRVRAKADEVAGKYYGRRCAMHLMAQPVIAEGVLSDPVLVGQGFLARCLLAWPESTIGTRQYNPGNLTENSTMRRYWSRAHDLLGKQWPLAAETRNELKPRALTLEPDAYALWVQIANSIEAQMTNGGEFESVKAWASKAASQVARVAGVLTLFDNADAQAIGRHSIEQAAELVLWHLGEARRIVGTATVPTEIQHAEQLLQWCHETGRAKLCSVTALQYGPNCIRDARAFNAAVKELEQTGWARALDPERDNMEIDGKDRRRGWQIARAEQ